MAVLSLCLLVIFASSFFVWYSFSSRWECVFLFDSAELLFEADVNGLLWIFDCPQEFSLRRWMIGFVYIVENSFLDYLCFRLTAVYALFYLNFVLSSQCVTFEWFIPRAFFCLTLRPINEILVLQRWEVDRWRCKILMISISICLKNRWWSVCLEWSHVCGSESTNIWP